MGNDIVIPDYLKAMMAQGVVKDTTADMLSQSGGVPRLTTKGKTFRFKNGEEEVKSGQSVDLIIIGQNPEKGMAHTFYKDGYTPDSNSPPDCSSNNGVVPDAWITNPVSDVCARCPNQAWGSAKSMSGGKAKACKDSRHLYVAKAEDFSKNPETAVLYLMQVTVNSLKNYSDYGKSLAMKGLPGPQFVITRVTFDDEASVPLTKYEMIGVLNDKLGMSSHTRAEKKEWSFNTGQALIGSDGPSNNKRELPAIDHKVIAAQAADVDTLMGDWEEAK
jgi:hypothetical protein